MFHRQIMSSKLRIPPGMKLVPAFSQQEPIRMMTGSLQPFQPITMVSKYHESSVKYNNSFKNNRIALQESNYKAYSQPNNSMLF